MKMILDPVPKTRELKVHNDLLGNRAALDEAWERDGYWFFRNVLDKDAVGRLRRVYVRELEKQGVIAPVGSAPTDRSVRYNGASLDDFPPHMGPLNGSSAWQDFVAERPIHDFFAKVLDDEPHWVPIVEYRATPPAADRQRTIVGIHQDGPMSAGIPFRICWVPLAEIDADIGGMIFAEGLTDRIHRAPAIDALGTKSFIPLEQLPADCWRHTTYQAGDLLMVHSWTPHSGIRNVSDRFRMSIDLRVIGSREILPIIGDVASIAVDRVEIRDVNGKVTALRIGPNTFVRNAGPDGVSEHSGEEILTAYPPGTPAVVGHDGKGLAMVIRPPAGIGSETPSLLYYGR
ncbi:MAG: phytanoyl-CoA dioxygenase [Chthoniobacteraceae bacterium]